MTELEILLRAKMYLDKMANGIDPITDAPVPDSDCINQVRVSRCLSYVSGILSEVIKNGGTVKKVQKPRKLPFSVTREKLDQYTFDSTPVTITEIVSKINNLADSNENERLKYTTVTSFLIQNGFLSETVSDNGKKIKVPTKAGESIGISRKERAGLNGPYYVTVYSIAAQRYILDNLDSIIESNHNLSDVAELQGQPWIAEDDAALADLYKMHVPIPELAVTFKRTTNAIRSRLKKLGLIQ